MKFWNGYPIDDDRHTARPWWRVTRSRVGYSACCETFRRVDGRRAPGDVVTYRRDTADGDDVATTTGLEEMEAALARIDAEHPLPAPPPMCGQVWLDISDGESVMVVAAHGESATLGDTPLAAWPPHPTSEHSGPWVLVDGPTEWGRHCQWAPMGAADE